MAETTNQEVTTTPTAPARVDPQAWFGLIVDLVLVIGLTVAVCLGKLSWSEAGPVLGILAGGRLAGFGKSTVSGSSVKGLASGVALGVLSGLVAVATRRPI